MLRPVQVVRIAKCVDDDFRAFLINAAPAEIAARFAVCFADGPSKAGRTEALAHFGGDPQHPAILSTVPVIEECERFKPGIQKWLEQTGFGNDLRMIQAFARWAEIGQGERRLA